MPLPPRLWPAVTSVVAYWLFCSVLWRLELPTFFRFVAGMAVPTLLALAFLIWWWLNRRIRLLDRLCGFGLVVAGGVAAALLSQPSLGPAVLTWGVPVVLSALVLWLVVAKRAPLGVWRVGLAVVVLLAWGHIVLLRMEGIRGDLRPDWHWRWSPTNEELFLTEREREGGGGPDARPDEAPPAALALTPGDWPGFRGPDRDGVVRGETLATDWDKAPPRPVWRQRVGPAWSSVIVVAGRLFTQEQRGDREAVVCYDAATGREVWAHDDPARFEAVVSGPGPRATPTFADGRLYAQGATGVLNCLDAATGRRVWSRDLTADTGARVPAWGFAGSPLVAAGVVTVFAGGENGKELVAYRADSGEPAWAAAVGTTSYTSPQPAVLAGQAQVLSLSDQGVTALRPETGEVLWRHAVPLPGAPRSVQPHVVGQDQVLIASEVDLGLALLDVSYDGTTWAATRRWASRDLKPAFNDFVVYEGHAYGFDGRLFTCVDLRTGKRRWKEGRYGEGQVVLLADQGLLLVVSEDGEAVLLTADPRRHEELGRFQAVNGKTWNHPVVANGRLYLRNAEEMACYDVADGPAR